MAAIASAVATTLRRICQLPFAFFIDESSSV
jgi:hypothetical protein